MPRWRSTAAITLAIGAALLPFTDQIEVKTPLPRSSTRNGVG
jgi:hypothetical protein